MILSFMQLPDAFVISFRIVTFEKNKMVNQDCSVIILAAGNSERMRFPKAFLKWKDQTVFLEKIIREYENFACPKIIAVINRNVHDLYCNYGYSFLQKAMVVVNPHPEFGRLSSIRLGMEKTENSKYCFIQNVDNPFVNGELLELLYNKKNDNAYIVPMFGGRGGHPILINRPVMKLIGTIEDSISDFKTVLSHFCRENAETRDEKILLNINTMEEYQLYFADGGGGSLTD
ncbi:MAG: NTP transferase domain-containing protein [Bacteroidia bacterium]|nr:NTP transferase domain-containing protein [Bacteroidia bacterium]